MFFMSTRAVFKGPQDQNAYDIKVRKGWSMLAGSALTAKKQSDVFIFTNLYLPVHDKQ